MQGSILFYAVFLSQLLLISHFLPAMICRRIRHMFITFPPHQYPNLYPEPVDKYENGLRWFRYGSLAILLALLAGTVALRIFPGHDGLIKHMVELGFLVQIIPMIFLEISTHAYYKNMRQASTRTTRTASLRPRRLFDYVSPTLVAFAAIVYLAFAALITYINQFNYPWFGGYANLVGVTAINLVFVVIIARNLYGKKLDPHQVEADRSRHIASTTKQMVVVSIAMTVYLAIVIVMASQELRAYQSLITSLYVQLLAVVTFRTMPVLGSVNFDVYKDNSVGA